MLRTILGLLTLLLTFITGILKRRKPAPAVKDIIGEPEAPSYVDAAKAAAEAAADEKFTAPKA